MNLQTLLSYEHFKAYKGIERGETADDTRLRRLCRWASRQWTRQCRRTFMPEIANLYHDYKDPSRLWLRRELLELTTFTNGDSETLTEGTDIVLMPLQGPPYNWIDRLTDSGNLFDFEDTPQKALQVNGAWGWHDDWSDAWQDSGDALAAAVENTTGTSLTVSNGMGQDALGMAPRFAVDTLIKVDSEYLWITDVASTTLTVIRGVNGSTAATHENAATIYNYQVPWEVQHAITRWTSYLYEQKDSGVYETTAIPEAGVITIPQGIPKDVSRLIKHFTDRSR